MENVALLGSAFVWPPQPVIYAIGGMVVSLLVGSAARLLALRHAAADFRRTRLGSLRTWWVIVLLLALALLAGRAGCVLLLAAVSLLGLREYFQLTALPAHEFRVTGWLIALLLAQYAAIYFELRPLYLVLLPLAGVMLVAVRMVVRERAEQFLEAAGGSLLGLMLTGYLMSHAAMLLVLPAESNPVAGPLGWLLYLLVLTAVSDISQALVGRKWGRRPIAPVLSPKKTQLGLVGGVAATTLLAVLLAPALTPLAATPLPGLPVSLGWITPALAGLLISLSGYFGDLTISGIKRDRKVKDSGSLLPGQGGILDRIDSLMFSAPVFLYFVVALVGW